MIWGIDAKCEIHSHFDYLSLSKDASNEYLYSHSIPDN